MYVYVSKQVGYVCNEMPKEKKKEKSERKGKIKRVGKEKKNASGVFFPGFSGGGGRVKGLAALKDVVSLA